MALHVALTSVYGLSAGSVSQAILSAAGPSLVEDCKRFGECGTALVL